MPTHSTLPKSPKSDLSEPERVRLWRYERLRAAGAGETTSDRLAKGEGDLHRMLDSIAAGCDDAMLLDIFE